MTPSDADREKAKELVAWFDDWNATTRSARANLIEDIATALAEAREKENMACEETARCWMRCDPTIGPSEQIARAIAARRTR